MRSILLASVALTATLTSALAPSIADACGGYMRDPLPIVYAVDDHNVLDEGSNRWQRRSFVMLGGTAVPADVAWKDLAPGTFDMTRIADLPDPVQSRTFTLVGPSGSRVVSTNRSALLAQTFRNRGEQGALEIPVDERAEFRIAVYGVQSNAKWLKATDVASTTKTLAWVKKQGLETTYVYVSKIEGTRIQVISAHGGNDTGLTSFVVVDGNSIGTFSGNPIGALDLGSKRYVILESDGMITPVAV